MYFFHNAVSNSYSFIHSRNKYFPRTLQAFVGGEVSGEGGRFMKYWEWKGWERQRKWCNGDVVHLLWLVQIRAHSPGCKKEEIQWDLVVIRIAKDG